MVKILDEGRLCFDEFSAYSAEPGSNFLKCLDSMGQAFLHPCPAELTTDHARHEGVLSPILFVPKWSE